MNAEDVMDNIRNAFERLGMTLNELGQGLGYDVQLQRSEHGSYRLADNLWAEGRLNQDR